VSRIRNGLPTFNTEFTFIVTVLRRLEVNMLQLPTSVPPNSSRLVADQETCLSHYTNMGHLYFYRTILNEK